MERAVPWAGIFPATLTFFDRSGRVDAEAMSAHIDRLIADGATGIVAGGTSGEFILLTDDERIDVIRIAVDAAHGRVPVIAGTGYASTAQTLTLTQQAADAGAAGAIVILPYYFRPTEAEVLEHYLAVGRSSRIPIMVYNNPANSAAPALEPPRVRALFEAGAAQAVKSTFPTVHEIHELRAEMPIGFRIFYGSFMAPLEGLAGGADGWISGILNVATRDAVDLWNSVRAGDLAAARERWSRILPLKLLYTRHQVGPAGDIALYRAILRLRGFEAGGSRAPVRDLSPEQVRALAEILRPLGLIP